MREASERFARVISVGRNAAWVSFEDDDRVLVAEFRKREQKVPLVPGDVIAATALDADRVVVDRRVERSSELVRTTQGGRTKTMAANIDGIAVVAAFARPALHLPMIDELLAFAELHELAAAVVLTKPDLAEGDDATAIPQRYRAAGFTVFCINPKMGAGVTEIESYLHARHTLLVGQSGVGKSSLFKALGGAGSVGDVSKIGRGKQTTTAGRLHRFDAGFLIDSPGVGEFELEGMTAANAALGFVEFATVPACRFVDCAHLAEPGCSVRAAVEAGTIARSRYESYVAIAGRLNAVRAW